MKFTAFILFALLSLQSCYVYGPLQATEDKPIPTLKEQIEPSKYYQIRTADKQIKIETVRWEQDSLVYMPMKKDELKKLHINQIQSVDHRQFSRGKSDALTFGAYAIVGVLIYLVAQ